MEGEKVATVIDTHNDLEIQVYLANGWFFPRIRRGGTKGTWVMYKPSDSTVDAIDEAYNPD